MKLAVVFAAPILAVGLCSGVLVAQPKKPSLAEQCVAWCQYRHQAGALSLPSRRCTCYILEAEVTP